VGSRLEPSDGNQVIEVTGESPARLIGLSPFDLLFLDSNYQRLGELAVSDSQPVVAEVLDIPPTKKTFPPQNPRPTTVTKNKNSPLSGVGEN
jgi:ATP-binding cassette subfamily B protein